MGRPDAVNVTTCALPLTRLTRTLKEADSPWFTVSAVGPATLTLKSKVGGGGGFTGTMLSVIDAVAIFCPLTPWIVIGKLPVAVELVVISVRVELNGGLCDWGLKADVTPAGTFSRLNWIGCG